MLSRFLLLLVMGAAPCAHAGEPGARKSGGFGLGAHLELGGGLVQGLGPGGVGVHTVPRIGLEYELRPNLSLPLGFRLQRGVEAGEPTFARIALDGVLLYRLRSPGGAWAVGAGAGLQVGAYAAIPVHTLEQVLSVTLAL